jgi:enoyl-CoA hydratase/carnithine racemase
MVAIARNVGRKRALEMALSGDVIDATTAQDWGLVNQVVPAAAEGLLLRPRGDGRDQPAARCA